MTQIGRSQIALAFLALITMCVGPLFAQTLNENQLKANYLVSFVDFIHWDRSGRDRYVIGLVGRGSLERELQSLIQRNKSPQAERSFKIMRITEVSQLQGVDILFFDGDSHDKWDGWLAEACEQGILTVGDGESFLDGGGLIEFRIVRNRLRFALNHNKVGACGIGFNAKLARLAINEEP